MRRLISLVALCVCVCVLFFVVVGFFFYMLERN